MTKDSNVLVVNVLLTIILPSIILQKILSSLSMILSLNDSVINSFFLLCVLSDLCETILLVAAMPPYVIRG